MDPDEDVSLPAMSALISRFRDSLLFNFCIVVQSVYLPVFLCGGCCMLLMLLYHSLFANLLRSTAKPVRELKQAKVWMVVARRNIKSTGIGIRETSGGEMTGSNEWLIHK